MADNSTHYVNLENCGSKSPLIPDHDSRKVSSCIDLKKSCKEVNALEDLSHPKSLDALNTEKTNKNGSHSKGKYGSLTNMAVPQVIGNLNDPAINELGAIYDSKWVPKRLKGCFGPDTL